MNLEQLTAVLREAPGLALKRDIQKVSARLPSLSHSSWNARSAGAGIQNGDDAAAIPDGDGYLLFAAEGMLPSFVQRDPWFAGFSSVMVNVSDIVAMGGRPLAVVDVLFAGDDVDNERILAGLRDAHGAFGVPIVGGHTSRLPGATALAVAIVGRAQRLITSFDAAPGQEIVAAVDLRGAYRGAGNNFNAATCASSEHLRQQLSVLPELAEAGLVRAGKDVSMAGLTGTLVMLCESSGCGAVLDVHAVPRPSNVPLDRWLQTFPSYGFILAVEPRDVARVCAHFSEVGVSARSVGCFQEARTIELRDETRAALYWDLDGAPLTGFSAPPRGVHGVAP